MEEAKHHRVEVLCSRIYKTTLNGIVLNDTNEPRSSNEPLNKCSRRGHIQLAGIYILSAANAASKLASIKQFLWLAFHSYAKSYFFNSDAFFFCFVFWLQ